MKRPDIRIALVGCGKAKADTPRKARELYTSQLFQKSLKHAERTSDYVFIVSAFHHLIQPNDTIQPYDRELDGGKNEKEAWAGRTASFFGDAFGKLKRVFHDLQKDNVVITIYAGANYADPLQGALIRAGFLHIHQPLKGLQVGQRLQWLKDQEPQKCPWCKGGHYKKGEQHRCGFKEQEHGNGQVRSRRRAGEGRRQAGEAGG